MILADYTKTGKYCIYEPLVGDRVREENAKEMLFKDKKDRQTSFQSILEENTKAIYHIHALQNYLQKYPNKANIDFDLIVPHLKTD